MRKKEHKIQPYLSSEDKRFFDKQGETDTERVKNIIALAKEKTEEFNLSKYLKSIEMSFNNIFSTIIEIMKYQHQQELIQLELQQKQALKNLEVDLDYIILKQDWQKDLDEIHDYPSVRSTIQEKIMDNLKKLAQKHNLPIDMIITLLQDKLDFEIQTEIYEHEKQESKQKQK